MKNIQENQIQEQDNFPGQTRIIINTSSNNLQSITDDIKKKALEILKSQESNDEVELNHVSEQYEKELSKHANHLAKTFAACAKSKNLWKKSRANIEDKIVKVLENMKESISANGNQQSTRLGIGKIYQNAWVKYQDLCSELFDKEKPISINRQQLCDEHPSEVEYEEVLDKYKKQFNELKEKLNKDIKQFNESINEHGNQPNETLAKLNTQVNEHNSKVHELNSQFSADIKQLNKDCEEYNKKANSLGEYVYTLIKQAEAQGIKVHEEISENKEQFDEIIANDQKRAQAKQKLEEKLDQKLVEIKQAKQKLIKEIKEDEKKNPEAKQKRDTEFEENNFNKKFLKQIEEAKTAREKEINDRKEAIRTDFEKQKQLKQEQYNKIIETAKNQKKEESQKKVKQQQEDEERKLLSLTVEEQEKKIQEKEEAVKKYNAHIKRRQEMIKKGEEERKKEIEESTEEQRQKLIEEDKQYELEEEQRILEQEKQDLLKLENEEAKVIKKDLENWDNVIDKAIQEYIGNKERDEYQADIKAMKEFFEIIKINYTNLTLENAKLLIEALGVFGIKMDDQRNITLTNDRENFNINDVFSNQSKLENLLNKLDSSIKNKGYSGCFHKITKDKDDFNSMLQVEQVQKTDLDKEKPTLNIYETDVRNFNNVVDDTSYLSDQKKDLCKLLLKEFIIENEMYEQYAQIDVKSENMGQHQDLE